MKNNIVRGVIFWTLILVALAFLWRSMSQVNTPEVLTYSKFKSLIKENKVKEVQIKSDMIKGKYVNEKNNVVPFRTIPVQDLKLVEELEAAKINYAGELESTWVTALLANVGWIIIFFLIWFFMIRQLQGGSKQVFSFGRSKAKMHQQGSKNKVTFSDVAGCEEAKEELKEIIEFLKDPAKFQKLGGKIPKGVILYGAPGTGKTLLAKAVAGEAGVPFFSSSGSEFVEMFVGVGASRVRDLFDQGRKNAPCLLFIDELDAVGRHRFAGIGGGHDEREQTLNQLLVEMDGFDTKEGVILIAATNRPDVLDPALLRPGRFDRHVYIPSPDLRGREAILKVHSKNIKLEETIDLKVLAQRTPGFVGADLANLANEAALLAARKNKTAVGMEELEESVERIMAGPERKSRLISDREKNIVAFHESGHALVAKSTPGSDPVHKISIISRGIALGYTLQLPTEDRYLTSKTEMIAHITSLLGGRAAEELVFNELTTGSQNDLTKATDLAVKMICEFGMNEKIGPITLKKREEETFLGRDIVQRDKLYSEKTAQIIDEEIKNIITGCEEKAKKILTEKMDKLKLLSEKLIEKETLDGEEVERILNGKNEVQQTQA